MKFTKLILAVMLLSCFAVNGEVISGGAPDPANADLMFWLQPDSLVGLSNGDPVAIWPDSSTKGNDFTGSLWAAGHNPTYNTSDALNGYPVVSFDSTAKQWLGLEASAITLDGPLTMIVVVKEIWASDLGSLCSFNRSDNGYHQSTMYVTNTVLRTDSRSAKSGDGSNTTASVNTNVTLGNPMIAIGTFANSGLPDFGVHIPYMNGLGSDTPAICRDPSYDRIGIGAMTRQIAPDNFHSFVNGDIAEVLVYNRVLDAGELNDIGYYLSQKYSITTSYQFRAANIIETDGSTVVLERNAGSDTFDVVLREAPTQNVVITADPNGTDITLAGASAAGEPIDITFTPADWYVPQTVTVIAINDTDPENEEGTFIEFTVASADTNFDGTLVLPVSVTIIDDDSSGILIDEGDGLSVSEQGPTQDTYTISLLGVPTQEVYVYPADNADTDQVTFSPNPVVFTTSNYNVPQTVTITAIDDDVLENTHYTTISHTVESADLAFNELPVPTDPMNVTIEDNECGVWGYYPEDLNKDCQVNLEDIAQMAGSWLGCTDPKIAGCQSL